MRYRSPLALRAIREDRRKTSWSTAWSSSSSSSELDRTPAEDAPGLLVGLPRSLGRLPVKGHLPVSKGNARGIHKVCQGVEILKHKYNAGALTDSHGARCVGDRSHGKEAGNEEKPCGDCVCDCLRDHMASHHRLRTIHCASSGLEDATRGCLVS